MTGSSHEMSASVCTLASGIVVGGEQMRTVDDEFTKEALRFMTESHRRLTKVEHQQTGVNGETILCSLHYLPFVIMGDDIGF